jgi:capsular polysaccharide biosynthesis protein
MSVRSLRTIRAEMPDWLEPDQVRSTLAEIFAAVEEGDESADEVASALLDLMTRAAENDEWLSPAEEQRILDWVAASWAVEPAPHFNRLCALLVNVSLPQAAAFLRERLDEETDPSRKATLRSSLDDRDPPPARDA